MGADPVCADRDHPATGITSQFLLNSIVMMVSQIPVLHSVVSDRIGFSLLFFDFGCGGVDDTTEDEYR